MINIGETLRNARIAKGINIEEVVRETKIRSRYLDALENEEWSIFPGNVYLKGFLKTYSNYLGLNEKELLDALGKETTPPEPDSYKAPKKIELPGRPRKKLGVIFGIIAIILLATSQYIYITFLSQPNTWPKEGGAKHEPPVSLGDTAKPVGSEPALAAKEPEDAAVPGPGTSSAAPQDNQTGLNLTLKSIGSQCWVRIRDGQKIVFEGTLKDGDEKLFSDLPVLEFTLGNSGAVQYYINGTDYGIPGTKPGQVIFKKYILEDNVVKEVKIPDKKTKPPAIEPKPTVDVNATETAT